MSGAQGKPELSYLARAQHAHLQIRRHRLIFIPRRQATRKEEKSNMKTRAAICFGLNQPWTVEEIDVDEPNELEVEVEMAYAGLCHSDEHLRDGTMEPHAETLEMFGLDSVFPIIGGHEGAGVVTRVGTQVTDLAPGDHVAVCNVPSCGYCFWCVTGRGNLCDRSAAMLAGPSMSDGTWHHHLNGVRLNRNCQLGTFTDRLVCHNRSVLKIDPSVSLRAAALISCGLATGFGSAVTRGKVAPGEVVVVVGCGGVGSGAIEGSRITGAGIIVAVDPIEFKRSSASKIGATHVAVSTEEALPVVRELTHGRMADVVILTPSILYGDLLGPALRLVSKDGRLVCTAAAPTRQETVKLDLFEVVMYNKAILGANYGSSNARVAIPRLLSLYQQGALLVDELVTREYALNETQAGYDDMLAGVNIRGVINFS
jgi:NDMA-dependent alcohol dehydrogenase